MNMIHTGLKALACGLGALVITTMMSWSFVESTATPPAANALSATAHMAKLSIERRHVWFGQSRPAVLVD